MRDYIAYHNPETMDGRATDVRELNVFTNHPGKCALGDRVWLITGEGHPRTFFLRMYYTVNAVRSSRHVAFSSEISGNDGRLFDPMPQIDRNTWFAQLKARMANFSLGFQPINDPEVVRGLEVAAGIASSAASAT